MSAASSVVHWQGTRAARRAMLLAIVVPATGAVLGRPDLVLLAAPLLIGTVLALSSASGRGEAGTQVNVARHVGQGERLEVDVEVEIPASAQAAVVRLPSRDDGVFGAELTVAATGARRRTRSVVHPERWGPTLATRPDLRVVGADALVVGRPITGRPHTVHVLPGTGIRTPAPIRPRALGVGGAHRTRRPGEGSDPLDIGEFRRGDRLRRIDWRVSARRGALHVRRSLQDADADAVLLLDTRHDVGPDAGAWSAPSRDQDGAEPGSSLDLAVRTGLSVARELLDQGDRVAMADLARPALNLGPGTGRRQLRRIRARLADVRSDRLATRLLARAGATRSGGTAVVFSPFLDDEVSALALRLRRHGRDVVAVDAMPRPIRLGAGFRAAEREWGVLAARLVLAEREQRLDALRAAGVAVCAADPTAIGQVLRSASRRRMRSGR